MKIILLGPPGAGKGTQAELICKRLGIPHISTGDMLRAAIAKGDPFGLSIKAIVDAGGFVPDEAIIQLVKERIKAVDCEKGFILDGFPRTEKQAESLDASGVDIDFVVVINVADDVIVKRLSSRWIHQSSGRTYNTISHPPKVTGLDDVTGEPLTQRPDDNEKTVRDRLATFHQKTQPLIAAYKKFQQQGKTVVIEVDGTKSEDEVCAEIINAMNKGKEGRAVSRL